MKKKTLGFILTLCMTVTGVVCFAAGAAAAGGLQEIKAYLNADITLKLDGEAQVLTDASGVRTYPITYNGTTYLPIRSIGTLLGVDVGWDQATQSVLLGKQPSGVDLIDTYKNYHHDKGTTNWVDQYQTGDADPMEISGVNCSRWLKFGKNLYSGDEKTTAAISFNLGGKHDTLTFSYYADCDMKFQVLRDNGAVLFEKDITGGQVAQTVTIPLLKTSQLTFQITNIPYNWEGRAYVFDAYLDAEQ